MLFIKMLQNWEYLAQELNIKWAVLALDDDLYDELGSRTSDRTGEYLSVG